MCQHQLKKKKKSATHVDETEPPREVLGNYQYPFNEHVVVLLDELRSAEDKATKKLNSCLSYTGGVVHEATMNPTLHIQLKNMQGRLVKHK